ncbi:MAG: CbiX/SirB N-terminal domain-containing protein [Pseudonocardia sp.]
MWTQRFGWSGGSAAFAATAEPAVSSAVAALRAGGARRIAVAQWFLAPGLLPAHVALAAQRAEAGGAGRRAEAGGVAVADPLGADAEVAAVIIHRYQAAARARRARTATMIVIADLEQFWPSRRGHAFDELCR